MTTFRLYKVTLKQAIILFYTPRMHIYSIELEINNKVKHIENLLIL